jgi:RNA polymerase sigma factor (TIGR02999 family)
MQDYQLTREEESLVQALKDDLALKLADQIPQFYQELKRIASRERSRMLGNVTLHTTELVNELYLKFVRTQTKSVTSVEHFMALCAVAIRRLLVDRARRTKLAQNYQAERSSVQGVEARTLRHSSASESASNDTDNDLLLVHDALNRLAQFNARLARVVECRWFAGYSEEETAQILGITGRTVRRDWEKAQLWLSAALA